MKLPNAEAAIIAPEKIRDYLLSPDHPIGRYKAAFFGARGYEQNDWKALAADIRALLAYEAKSVATTKFGQKYLVTGPVAGPSGHKFGLTTVWIILKGENAPRFVTAYPEG